jgi:hypothetical protein
MKKVLLGGALMAVAALGAAGPASAKAVHWNVKCIKPSVKLDILKLRKGVDCAHVVKAGQTWKFPKGTWFAREYASNGTPLSLIIHLDHPTITKAGPQYDLGFTAKGGYGKIVTGESPVSVTATKTLIVVASTQRFMAGLPTVITVGKSPQ